ncbi:uncharacterized protein STEHIDRAFT_154493 [Stereum hirsutum FP-91666 SS1]|uniref:uncharacterized protein n=1 Tax=Stereum hirsutum (strain FP-91666) TaxID=721885 RepID=UPI000440F447|nr:uncharacterized protein STEHIDRAFT_154493 [Stereum hirsutum FP-91666 SS1]EIM88772.1 hypothetical protein STEHIDRAFT_154493 [Stereum hirsutum FP-91666 SS1]
MSDTVNKNGKRPHADGEEAEIKEADAPFNAPSADFILRAFDNVDFRVHKVILSVASPVFESMFTLPDSKADTQYSKDGLPVLACPEPAAVLDPVLRFCYPTATPMLTELTTLMPLYDAIDKYCMESLLHTIEAGLVLAVEQDCMVAYAFACRHHLQPVITAAAKASLTTPLQDLPFVEELEMITGAQLFRLQEYHRACSKAATLSAKHWKWLSVSDIPLGSTEAGCKCCGRYSTKVEDVKGSVFDSCLKNWGFWAPLWWWDYLGAMEKALALRPRGSTATDKDALDPFLRKAAVCSNEACRAGIKTFLEFAETFSAQIEKVIDRVKPPY